MPSSVLDILSITIGPLERPEPGADSTEVTDRDGAAPDLSQWREWPFELELVTSAGTRKLYGHPARLWLKGWAEAHT
jgi:hypothetical protein